MNEETKQGFSKSISIPQGNLNKLTQAPTPPILIRTSKLSKDVNQNTHLVTPILLTTKSDILSMTMNWSKKEIQSQRRLVKFNFVKKSISNFEIQFQPISSREYSHNLPIISCIYWKEQGIHIVTSVDIVLILEYLIQQSFSIEEKNRIRRNLQSLKPYTISRTGTKNAAFFSLLMNLEDPRPRNIEKDLKVFHWSDILLAIEKVVSKYSPNLLHSENKPSQDAQVTTKISQGNEHLSHTSDNIITDNIQTSDGGHELISFMPNERLKVLKRKLNKNSNLHHMDKNRIFQHALTPTEPIPLRTERNNRKKKKVNTRREHQDQTMINHDLGGRELTLSPTNQTSTSESEPTTRQLTSKVTTSSSNVSLSSSKESTSRDRGSSINEQHVLGTLSYYSNRETETPSQYYQYPSHSVIYSQLNQVKAQLASITPTRAYTTTSKISPPSSISPNLANTNISVVGPSHTSLYEPFQNVPPRNQVQSYQQSSPKQEATKYPIYKAPGLYYLPQPTNRNGGSYLPKPIVQGFYNNVYIPKIRQLQTNGESQQEPNESPSAATTTGKDA